MVAFIGAPLFVVGRAASQPGRMSSGCRRRFRQPTDVTWGPNGEIYISDGYVNSRVAKLDKDFSTERLGSSVS